MDGHDFYTPARILLSIIALSTAVCLTSCAFLHQQTGSGGISAAEIETRVVCVGEHAGVEPGTLSVRPGTAVIWLNQSGNDIRIMLSDRKVSISCLSPVNFDSTAEGFCTSGRLQPGALASLCFVQTGSYAYSVERFIGTGQLYLKGSRPEGTIIVR